MFEAASHHDQVIFLAVVIGRFLLPLLIPFFPFPAIVVCLILDAADQTIFQKFTTSPEMRMWALGYSGSEAPAEPIEYRAYDGYDKALDIYYLTMAYLSIMKNWVNLEAFEVGDVADRQSQHVGRRFASPPGIEVPGADDALGDSSVVEGVEIVVVDDRVASPRALFALACFLDQPVVVMQHAVPILPVAFDEGVPDEELPGSDGIDAVVVDAAVRDEGHAVERHLLGADGAPPLARPHGVAIVAPEE